MDWVSIVSLVLNAIFGGGFLVTIMTLRSERKKANAQAKEAELDTIEKGTEILMNNIVTPLKKELYEVRKEIKRLRRAIDKAKYCSHSADCPVIKCMQADSEDDGGEQ